MYGGPIARATITGRGVWTQTDDTGFFQLEAPQGVPLEVLTSTGVRYALGLPEEKSAGEPVVRLGAVICCEDQFDGAGRQLSQLANPPKGKGN